MIKEAIEGFEQCLDSAKATDGLIKNLPREQVKLAASVRRRQVEARKARAAIDRHGEDRAFGERAARKDAEVYERLMYMANQIERKTQNADARVNLFAQERTVTLGHVRTAREKIETIGAREGRPGGASARSAAAPLLPNANITQEFRRLVEEHRANSPDLTTLGVKALREKTRADVEALFVGKAFTFGLKVNDIAEASPNAYVLIAEQSEDWGDKVVNTVEFQFDAGSKYDLIKCKRGATVEVEVRITKAVLRPDFPSLETSNEAAGVHLIGDVVTVRRGCQWN